MDHHEGVYSQIIEVTQANSNNDYLASQLVQGIIVQNDSDQVETDNIVHNDKQMENVILQQVAAVNDSESLQHLNNVDGTIVAYTEEHKEGDYILHDQGVVYQEHYEVTSTEIHREIVTETIAQAGASVPQIDVNESVPASTHDQPTDNHIVQSEEEIVHKVEEEEEVVSDTRQDINNAFANETNAAAFISSFNTEAMEVDEVCTSNEVIQDNVIAVQEPKIENEDHSTSNVEEEKVVVDSSYEYVNESEPISSTGEEQVQMQEQQNDVAEAMSDSKVLVHSDDVAILTEFSSNEYNTKDEYPEDEVIEAEEAPIEMSVEETVVTEEVAVPEEELVLSEEIAVSEEIPVAEEEVAITEEVVIVVEEPEEKIELVEEPDSNECTREEVEEPVESNDVSQTELAASHEEEDMSLQLSTQSNENHTSKVIQDIFDDWQDGEEESNHAEQPADSHNDSHQDSVELELQSLLNDGAQQEQTVSSTIENAVNSNEQTEEKSTRSQKSSSVDKSSADTRSSRSSTRAAPAKEPEGRSSRSATKDPAESKAKQPSPRVGVKQPGSHLTSQIASTAEITEALKEKLREKQKDISLPKTADLVFVNKITQRLSNQLLSGAPTVAPVVTPPVLPTSTSESSSSKEKTVESRRMRNESAGDRELLAILEGDVDPDWAHMDPNTSNEKQNTSSSSKPKPLTERELALKQLQELPGTGNKKGKQDVNQSQKKSRRSRQEERTTAEAKSADESEVTNSDSVSEKTPVKKGGRPMRGSKKEVKDDAKVEDKTAEKKEEKAVNKKESKAESKKDNKAESKKEKESKVDGKKEKESKAEAKKEVKDESKKDVKNENKKEVKDESKNESTASAPGNSVELGIEESRSGRKRKLTEKAREHELAVKRQKVTKKAVTESRKSSQDSNESEKSEKSEPSTPIIKEGEAPSSTSTPKPVQQSKAETKQSKTEAKKNEAEPEVEESKDAIVEEADTTEESSVNTETPVKKAKIGVVKKDRPIAKRKLAAKNLIKQNASKKAAARQKSQEKAPTPSKDTPEKATNTSGGSKPPTKKISEVDRLLQDEGIVNILYDVEQTDSKRRLVPITKTQKKVMDIDKAERELNFRKKMVKNAVLRSRNAIAASTSKISPRVRRNVTVESSPAQAPEKKANDATKAAKAANTSTPLPSDFVIPAKIRNAADASRIIRRHSSSSFSSASASPRVSIDLTAELGKIEEAEPQAKANRKLSNASDKQEAKKGKKRASTTKSEAETDESTAEKTPTKKTRSNVVPAGDAAKSTKTAANKSKKVPKSKSVSESSSVDLKSSPKRNEELSACLAEAASALSSVNGSMRSNASTGGRKKAASTNITKLLGADDEKVDSKKLLFSNKEINVRHHGHLVQLILTPSSSASSIRNAITIEAMNEIRESLSVLKKDDDCRVVLFTSTGTSFCEGLEISSLLHTNKSERKARAEEMAAAVKDFISDLAAFNKPIVAAVQGAAIGLGVTMLPLFDLVIASDKATFSTPYGKLGQIAEGAAVLTLSHSLGSAVTNELLLGGRVLTASEALRAGLVTRVLWPDRFQGELLPSLKSMSDQSSQSMIATKALLRHDLRQKLDISLESETLLLVQHWCSQECQEAMKEHITAKNH